MPRELSTRRDGNLSFVCLEGGDPRSARVLVLVHAFPLGVRMWEPQIDAAPPGWRVIAPAVGGFDGGPDADSGGEPSIDDYARQVLALVDALGVRRYVVAGVSMGGYVAFGLMRAAPERVQGLVLADTRSGPDSEQVRAGRQRALEIVARDGAAGIAADMVPKLLGRTTLTERPALAAHVRALIETQPASAIAAATRRMLTRPDSTPLLSTVAVPSLVIVGEEDTLTPPAEAEAMHRHLRHSVLECIPAAGHLSSLENSEAFNAVLARFLSRL